eukprot:c17706_g2_i1 orf=296-1429(+)
MAERAFFCPRQNDKDNAAPAQKQHVHSAEEDDQQQQQHSNFHDMQSCSYPSSFRHAYPSSPSSHASLSSTSCEGYSHPRGAHDHHLRHNHHAQDHHHHNNECLHLIDELRTCAKLKSEIVAHPLFDSLLQAHVQCLRVGISSNQLQAFEYQLEKRHSVIIKYLMLGRSVDKVHPYSAGCRREIDAFMENYLQLLISWKKQLEELVLPITIKAFSSLCEIEKAFSDLTGLSCKEISSTIRIDEDLDETCLDLELDNGDDLCIDSQCDIDQSLLDHVRMELKQRLKQSYKENIIAMREEIVRKRQAGKLPGDTTALKKWWNAHSRWPYPTEEEKRQLVQETGLEMRQINNWFINHRKRNWIDRAPPPNAAASAGSSSQN